MHFRLVPVPAPRFVCLILVGGTMLVGGCGRGDTEGWQSVGSASLENRYLERHGAIQFVNNVEAGCELAKKIGKPCLLFFTADWCTFCRRMEETTFGDPQIGQLSEQFVCVLVDADREQYLCRHFAITGFPTIQFLAPDHRRLDRVVGWQTPQNLAASMHVALERTAWLHGARIQYR